MSGPTLSPLDPYIHLIKEWADQGKTNAEIVKALHEDGIETSEASVRRAKKRDGNVAPRTKGEPTFQLKGDEATLNSSEEPTPPSPDDLMTKHGLNPEEWEVKDVILNEWTSMMGSTHDNKLRKLYQLKVILRRKVPLSLIFPARVPGDYVAPQIPKRVARTANSSKLWIVAGDQQAPYHDVGLHKALCGFISSLKPHGMVNTGDLLDFGQISKHRDSPDWNATVQNCVDTSYLLLRDYRQSHEGMRMVSLTGNHDVRLYREMLDRAERLYGVRKALVPGEAPEKALFSIGNLLRVDELNIELIDHGAEYEHGQFEITPDLVVRHGSRTGTNAAMKTMERINHGVIIGHTHHQSLNFKITYDSNKKQKILPAVETGCLCRIEGGLGYAVDPGWTAGFATVEEWPDGRTSIDLAQWDGEVLTWRGQQY